MCSVQIFFRYLGEFLKYFVVCVFNDDTSVLYIVFKTNMSDVVGGNGCKCLCNQLLFVSPCCSVDIADRRLFLVNCIYWSVQTFDTIDNRNRLCPCVCARILQKNL